MLTAEQKEHLKELCAALRSGEFEQGRLYLNKEDKSYCCLGVACELMVKKGLLVKARSVLGYEIVLYDRERGFLPPAARDYYGLKSNGQFPGKLDSLIALNDNGTPFPEIASIIEKEFDL